MAMDATKELDNTKPNTDGMKPLHGLRGICSILIFLCHYFSTYAIGFSSFMECQSVTLFFLISGIPLTQMYSITGALETLHGCKNFMCKRFARLAPAYYFGLILGLPSFIVYYVLPSTSIIEFAGSAATAPLFLQSILLNPWIYTLCWTSQLWQVSIFFACYFLYSCGPIRLEKMIRKSDYPTLFVIGLVCTLIPCIVQMLFIIYDFEDTVVLRCGLIRIFHFIVGVVLGEVVCRWTFFKSRVYDILDLTTDVCWFLIFGSIVSEMVWFNLFPLNSDISSTVSCLIEFWCLPVHVLGLFTLMKSENSIIRRILCFKPMKFLGDASLCIYCFHISIIDIYMWCINWELISTHKNLAWWHACILVPGVVMISLIYNHWISEPVRKFASKTFVTIKY